MEKILIRSGERRLAGMDIYKSEEDSSKSSKILKSVYRFGKII